MELLSFLSHNRKQGWVALWGKGNDIGYFLKHSLYICSICSLRPLVTPQPYRPSQCFVTFVIRKAEKYLTLSFLAAIYISYTTHGQGKQLFPLACATASYIFEDSHHVSPLAFTSGTSAVHLGLFGHVF